MTEAISDLILPKPHRPARDVLPDFGRDPFPILGDVKIAFPESGVYAVLCSMDILTADQMTVIGKSLLLMAERAKGKP